MTPWKMRLVLGLRLASFACFALALASLVLLVWVPRDWVLQLVVSLSIAAFGLWACAEVLYGLLRGRRDR